MQKLTNFLCVFVTHTHIYTYILKIEKDLLYMHVYMSLAVGSLQFSWVYASNSIIYIYQGLQLNGTTSDPSVAQNTLKQ